MVFVVPFVPAQTASADPPGDWTQFLRDNLQRWDPFETVLRVDNVGSLQLKWTQTAKSAAAFYTDPVVASGVVYVGGGPDSQLHAIDASTGQQIWSYKAKFAVPTTPAVVNGVIYLGTQDGFLYAVNAHTGVTLWRFNGGDTPSADITVFNGVVYFGVGDATGGTVYAVNANSGEMLWNYPAGITSAPAVANGVVYVPVLGVTGGGGGLIALNAHTGDLIWNYFVGGMAGQGVLGSPAVVNGVVYFSALDSTGTGRVYAIAASSGKTLWAFTSGSGARSSTPAVANGVVYVGSDDGNVYGLSAMNGHQLWDFTASGQLFHAPAVANGVVYVAGLTPTPPGAGTFYALNATTGAKLWNSSVGSHVGSPIVSNGTVYVTNTDVSSTNTNTSHVRAFSIGADLFLRVMPSPTTIHQDDLLTYSFPVWNLGPTNADFEVLTTEVPPGTTFDHIRISGTPGLGTCFTPQFGGTGIIVCHQNGSMAANATWTVRVTVRVIVPSGATITEKAVVLADTLDPNVANNAVTLSTKVH